MFKKIKNIIHFTSNRKRNPSTSNDTGELTGGFFFRTPKILPPAPVSPELKEFINYHFKCEFIDCTEDTPKHFVILLYLPAYQELKAKIMKQIFVVSTKDTDIQAQLNQLNSLCEDLNKEVQCILQENKIPSPSIINGEIVIERV